MQQTVQPVAWREFQRKTGKFDSRILADVRASLKRWLGVWNGEVGDLASRRSWQLAVRDIIPASFLFGQW